jgi:hypothetical protein
MPASGRERQYPVLQGGDGEPYLGDDLDGVMRGIYAELRAQNVQGALRGERQPLQHGGSRFAAEGASEEVLDTLAAGGAVHVRPPQRDPGV